MTDKRSRKIMIPASGGMTRTFLNRLKLILKLMADRRVSPWIKMIPLGALVYLISPIDIIMGIPGVAALDDAAVLWMGSTLFVELCPPEVVREYIEELSGGVDASDDVVDAESSDASSSNK
jgi:uncharacterized membrane protein YkvA (DUF1232 family)